jgi:hypothetical protein
MNQCRSCKANVIFVPSVKTGKPMILDAKPEKRVVIGHTIYMDSVQTFDPPGIQICPDASHGRAAQVVDVYTDHHVTCPDAASWKGRTRAQSPSGQATIEGS